MNEDDLKNIDIENDEEPVEEVKSSAPAERPDMDSVTEKSAKEVSTLTVTKHRHWVFIGIVGVVVVLGSLFWVFKDQVIGYIVTQPIAQTQAPSTTNEISAIDKQKVSDPELVKFITPTTGETWLSSPKEMTPQGWLVIEQPSYYQDVHAGDYSKSAADQLKENTPTYNEVGSRDGNTIVLVHSPSEGMLGMYYLFEKQPNGKVAAIIKPQAAGYYGDDILERTKDAVTAKVTIFDQTTRYDSLNIPAKIEIGNGESLQRGDYLGIGGSVGFEPSNGVTRTLVTTYGRSSLYRSEVTYADTHLTNVGYYILNPLGTRTGLTYEPNQTSLEGYTFDDKVSMQYEDGDGKMVYDVLYAIARGCGGITAAVSRSDSLKEADLVPVGKTNIGRSVYDLKDKSGSLYVKAYDEYKQSNGAQAVSFSEYVKNHGLMIIKDVKGEFLVYVRGQYAPSMGCAKPVVYLYPTTQTLVNVKVGADVTVSEPLYTVGGWKNVLARPDGQLTYQGKVYDSLFWEGQGSGSYPGITSGTVVKRIDAAATIRRQLAEQGLNAKETNDFMAFWESKIPNKPYIRLTWLNTEQMNALAPLRVNPKPNTVIRVFLDMDSFDAPISLPVQKLTKVERKGFTVVEWGGLTSEIRH